MTIQNQPTALRRHFLLSPDVIFLNHGSFGACPRPVFNAYHDWQRCLERQPVEFLGRRFFELDRSARLSLAAYLQADADDLAFVPNATQAVNIVLRSLALQPGDEILTTDHEYGACNHTLEFTAKKTGARVVRAAVPLPLPPEDQVVKRLWAGVTPRTRLIFISHITSPTAVRLPVEAICARARAAGILTLIDGAHAPGQVDLDLNSLGADFYTGNCHKWMLSPKGAAFLHAQGPVQELIEPLVVSWGYHPTPETTLGSTFLDRLAWTGTHDPAARLSVSAAIQFMQTHRWLEVRHRCHTLALDLRRQLCEITGIPALCPPQAFVQMFSVELPAGTDPDRLKARLYDRHRIEVPVLLWNGRPLLRVSIQGYNTPAETEALASALERELMVGA